MDQQLKQRLVGATVLVSLAVIFVPVILDGPRDDWMPRSSTMPDAPEIEFRSAMELPLPAAGPLPSKDPDQPPARVDQSVEKPAEPAAQPEQPVKAVNRKPPAVTSGKSAAQQKVAVAAARPASGWYVQVGSFSKQENAEGLRKQLQSAGFIARVEAGGKPSTRSYRVLVGPENTRKAADTLKSRLQSKRKLEGLVIEIGSG